MTVAKVTEIIASSPNSFEEAIKMGVERAQKTLDGVQGAWVKEQKIVMNNGSIKEYRVDLKVTFVLEN